MSFPPKTPPRSLCVHEKQKLTNKRNLSKRTNTHTNTPIQQLTGRPKPGFYVQIVNKAPSLARSCAAQKKPVRSVGGSLSIHESTQRDPHTEYVRACLCVGARALVSDYVYVALKHNRIFMNERSRRRAERYPSDALPSILRVREFCVALSLIRKHTLCCYLNTVLYWQGAERAGMGAESMFAKSTCLAAHTFLMRRKCIALPEQKA